MDEKLVQRQGKEEEMSAYYWQKRWVDALVEKGVERSTAETLYASTYRSEATDQSKSPELQAMLMLDINGGKAKMAARAAA